MDFNFSTDYILENDVVLLRPLTIEDFNELLPFAINEPELWTYSLKSAAGYNNMLAYIHSAFKARNDQNEYAFIIFDKVHNRFAGCTRLYDVQVSSANIQIGYTWLGKDFQGTGLNKNCKYLLLEFAFEVSKAMRVEFRADFLNKKSIAAMKSIGCYEEGVLRSNNYRSDGTRRDSVVLSILRDEWISHVKTNLNKKLAYHKIIE